MPRFPLYGKTGGRDIVASGPSYSVSDLTRRLLTVSAEQGTQGEYSTA